MSAMPRGRIRTVDPREPTTGHHESVLNRFIFSQKFRKKLSTTEPRPELVTLLVDFVNLGPHSKQLIFFVTYKGDPLS